MMIIIERGAELTQVTALTGVFSATENGEAFDNLKISLIPCNQRHVPYQSAGSDERIFLRKRRVPTT
jgi:hypothetical protein